MQQILEQSSLTPFTLNLVHPFSAFEGGEPKRTPCIVDGLLPEGGFSILAGKPKHGKSSLARCEAVSLAKGQPFLGREAKRGETLLISLEDPLAHVGNCLLALGWNPNMDAKIYVAEKLDPQIDTSISEIRRVLSERPEIRLVIIDTLAKLLRVTDANDYAKVLPQVEKVRNIARDFPHVHVQGLAHCKKVKTDDPFDSILGSTALRGEPDTTIALFDYGKQRVIATETRMGRNLPASILQADLIESAGADVVKSFHLGQPLGEFESEMQERSDRRQSIDHESAIVEHLESCEGLSDSQVNVLNAMRGRQSTKHEVIQRLTEIGVLDTAGTKHSPTDPLRLMLSPDALSKYRTGNQ